MKLDISHLLEEWDYVPGEVVVRKFTGSDGREKIQLRVDLGILQMNVKGRPDGKRPLGYDSWYNYYRKKQAQQAAAQTAPAFKLNAAECGKLLQEAIQYHHRYICLYQLKDYAGVLRDTERNLEAFDFVQQHAETEELAWSLQQFRPQLLMMRTRALAEVCLREGDFPGVIGHVEAGMESIREFYRAQARDDLLEQSGELRSLEAWLEELQAKRPRTERERLESALDEAVKREDYEKAARVRDALRQIKASG